MYFHNSILSIMGTLARRVEMKLSQTEHLALCIRQRPVDRYFDRRAEIDELDGLGMSRDGDDGRVSGVAGCAGDADGRLVFAFGAEGVFCLAEGESVCWTGEAVVAEGGRVHVVLGEGEREGEGEDEEGVHFDVGSGVFELVQGLRVVGM
ncbi:hypothetical protein OQA88_3556 [Cercophora sp. LCS_1]